MERFEKYPGGLGLFRMRLDLWAGVLNLDQRLMMHGPPPTEAIDLCIHRDLMVIFQLGRPHQDLGERPAPFAEIA